MYSRGEIVLIPVPFSDLTATKKRPVLVVSNNTYNLAAQDMVVVAITSNLVQPGIPIDISDMISGQLPKPSVIRSDKIYTLDQGIVVKTIGLVANRTLDDVRADIIAHIT